MPSPLAVRSTGEVVLPVPPPSSTAAAALEETREAVSVVWPERNETDMLIVLLHGDPDDVGREFSVRGGGLMWSILSHIKDEWEYAEKFPRVARRVRPHKMHFVANKCNALLSQL